MVQPKKITLSLSGGGIRSLASLGVIKYLDNGIFDIVGISGSSGGAIVSLLVSYGLSLEEIESFYLSIDKLDIFRPSLKSIFSLSVLEEKLFDSISERSLVMDFFICVTDLKTGNPVYVNAADFDKTEVIKYVIASCSLLPFFSPVVIGNNTYVDGGYSDNMPNQMFQELRLSGIENVSVNVNNVSNELSLSPIKLIKRILLITMNANIRNSKSNADIYINIDTLSNIGLFDFKKYSMVVDEGYKKAKMVLEN